jgi:hypothetical protein
VFPYSNFYHPPAPVIPAIISSLEDPTRSITREGKVDCGADITTIPMPINDFLIGRDVLNEWVLVLDGKNRILKIEG